LMGLMDASVWLSLSDSIGKTPTSGSRIIDRIQWEFLRGQGGEGVDLVYLVCFVHLGS